MSSSVDKVETDIGVEAMAVSVALAVPVDFLAISAVLVVFVVFVPLEASGVFGALETDAKTDDCLCCYNCCSA